MLKADHVILVGVGTDLATQAQTLLQPLYAGLKVVPDLGDWHDSSPALLLIDYAALPADDAILEQARQAGSLVVLLLPEDDTALAHAQTLPVDDFIMLPAEARSLPYRLRKLQTTPPLERQQYQMVSAITLSHAFSYHMLPDGTLCRTPDNEESFKRVFGFTTAELKERGGWQAVIHPDDLEGALAYRARMKLGEGGIHDYRVRVTPEETLWIREYSQPVTQDGRLVMIRGACQNVNSLKLAQQGELSRRESIKGLYRTAQILSANLETEAILDQVLISMGDLFPLDLGNIMLIQDKLPRMVRQRGYQERGLTWHVAKLTVNEDPVLSQIASSGKAFIIADLQQSGYAASDEARWAQAYIGAPLYIHEQLAGFLNLYSQHPYQYKEDHLFLLEAFASQISAALSNASFHNMLMHHSIELEQRIRDLVIVYEVGQALTATLNLNEIYRLLYREVVEKLFQASQMQIFLFEDQHYRCDFAVIDGTPIDPQTISLTPDEEACLEQLRDTGELCQQHDAIYEPLISNSLSVGVMKVIYEDSGEFNGDDRTLFSIVASVAAIAIENARLYTTVNNQHDEIKALYQATTSLYSTDDLQELGHLITRSVVSEFNYADCGLMLVDVENKILERVVRNGSYELRIAGTLDLNGNGLVPLAARSGQTVYAPDVHADSRYIRSDSRTQSELVIPLITSRGVIGVLDLQSTELNAFTSQDRRVLQAFAERAAVAIENLQLLAKIRQHASDLEMRVEERTIELRKALQKERELKELKSRFVMTVSHQFRTPLTAIQSSKELLKNYGDRMTPEQRDQRYDQLEQAINDITRLIEDAVMMNRMTEDDLLLNNVLVDMNAFIQQVISDFAATVGKSHEITYVSDHKEAFNLIDEAMWRKVVTELLLNATKFSAPGSKIECAFSSTGSGYVFKVRDYGIGVPAADLNRMFGMFDRGENVENIPGAGLGLTIVRQSIERQGGTVHLESQLGSGTTITIYLPRYILEEN